MPTAGSRSEFLGHGLDSLYIYEGITWAEHALMQGEMDAGTGHYAPSIQERITDLRERRSNPFISEWGARSLDCQIYDLVQQQKREASDD